MLKFNNLKNKGNLTIVESVIRRLVLIALLLIVGLLGVQFFILSSVGTIGPELSKVRNQREHLELDNEIKSAKIQEYQTSDEVISTVDKDLSMKSASVKRVEILDSSSAASALTVR